MENINKEVLGNGLIRLRPNKDYRVLDIVSGQSFSEVVTSEKEESRFSAIAV